MAMNASSFLRAKKSIYHDAVKPGTGIKLNRNWKIWWMRSTSLIGVSRQQKLKCGVIAFRDRIYLSFNSVMDDPVAGILFLEERSGSRT